MVTPLEHNRSGATWIVVPITSQSQGQSAISIPVPEGLSDERDGDAFAEVPELRQRLSA